MPITPRAFSSGVSEASLLRTPRTLNEPVFWNSSALSTTSPRLEAVKTGVRWTRPAIVPAARSTSSRVTTVAMPATVLAATPAGGGRIIRRDGSGCSSASPGAPRRHGRPAAVAGHRALPADPHDPALHRLLALVGRGLLRRHRSVVRRPLQRTAQRGSPQLPLRLHPVHHADERVPPPDLEPVAGVRHRRGLPGGRPDRRADTTEPLVGLLPAVPRASRPAPRGGHRRWRRSTRVRARRGPLVWRCEHRRHGDDGGDPRLVRLARARPHAAGASRPRSLRARLLRPDVLVPAARHGSVSVRRPAPARSDGPARPFGATRSEGSACSTEARRLLPASACVTAF